MSQTLLPVEDAIYRNRNVNPESYYAKCVKKDLLSIIHPTMRKMGFHFTYEGCYKRLGTAVALDTPWHHVKHLQTKRCGIDHQIKFVHFGFVPPRCLECWKVVVKPFTLKQLFSLLEVQKSLNRASKCGIELRHYTARHYGGYFYNNSIDEGRECYAAVKEAVDEHVGKDVPVILKRGCTEYEMILGPSVGWHMTKRHHHLEERLESIIDTYAPNAKGQTDEAIAQVHTHWMEWAWRNMDPTVDEYLGGVSLYPDTMTYHEGDINEVKLDLMRGHAAAKYGVEPGVIDAMHVAMRGFDQTKQIGFDKIGDVFGFDRVNPLFVGEGDWT